MALSRGQQRDAVAARWAGNAPAHPRLASGWSGARRHAVTLTLIPIVGLGFGLRAAQAAHPGSYISADERSYARVAVELARTGHYGAPGMRDPWHWAPGTPAAFALGHLVAAGADGDGSPQQLRSAFWVQALVGTALILVVFLLAAGLAGPLAGLLAAAAIAAYPPLIRATGDLVSEPLGALTLALAALALLGAWRSPTAGRLALTGVALGAALLVRADLVVLPLVLGAAWTLLARGRSGARAALAQGAVIAVVPLLVAAPWSIYASSNAGRFVPVASSGPSTLFVGTYLPGDGRLSGVRRELQLYVRRHMSNLADVPASKLPGEFVLRAYIRERHPEIVPGPYQAIPDRDLRAALAFEARRNLRTYALGRPAAFAGMEVRKVARMWGGPYRGGSRRAQGWLTAWHLALVALALAGVGAGLVLAPRRRAELALVVLPVVTSTAVNAFFVAPARHNLRMLPLLVAAGAAGAVLAVRALRARRPGLPAEADPPGDQITASRRAIVVRDRRPPRIAAGR